MSQESYNNTGFEHRNMVRKLVKNPEEILDSLTPNKCNLLHMAIGISGEAGELLDAVKKHTIYNQELNYGNVLEEIGDIEFYLQGLRLELNLNREQCLRANIEKLAKRYKGHEYTDEQAKLRNDKKEVHSVIKRSHGMGLGEEWQAVCSCGWKGIMHSVTNDHCYTNLEEEIVRHKEGTL